MPVFLLQELNTNIIPAKKNKIIDLAAFTIFDFAVPATNVLLIALAELVVFFMLFVLWCKCILNKQQVFQLLSERLNEFLNGKKVQIKRCYRTTNR